MSILIEGIPFILIGSFVSSIIQVYNRFRLYTPVSVNKMCVFL